MPEDIKKTLSIKKFKPFIQINKKKIPIFQVCNVKATQRTNTNIKLVYDDLIDDSYIMPPKYYSHRSYGADKIKLNMKNIPRTF